MRPSNGHRRSPSPPPIPRDAPHRPRSPTPEPDQFGRHCPERSPSPDLRSLSWSERMDRIMDRYDRQKDARDRLRAKYGELSPSPPRVRARQTPSPPPVRAALPVSRGPPRGAAEGPRGAGPKPGAAAASGLRNWEAGLSKDEHEPAPIFVDTKGILQELPAARAAPPAGRTEEDEAQAAFEARLRELEAEAEDEDEEGVDVDDEAFR